MAQESKRRRRRFNPEAVKWVRAFGDNVAAVLRVRSITSIEAEKVAFATTVTAFLDANRPNTDPARCDHCGSSERPDDLRPMGGGERHSWVHKDCWQAWSRNRRAKAIEALAAMGIVSP